MVAGDDRGEPSRIAALPVERYIHPAVKPVVGLPGLEVAVPAMLGPGGGRVFEPDAALPEPESEIDVLAPREPRIKAANVLEVSSSDRDVAAEVDSGRQLVRFQGRILATHRPPVVPGPWFGIGLALLDQAEHDRIRVAPMRLDVLGKQLPARHHVVIQEYHQLCPGHRPPSIARRRRASARLRENDHLVRRLHALQFDDRVVLRAVDDDQDFDQRAEHAFLVGEGLKHFTHQLTSISSGHHHADHRSWVRRVLDVEEPQLRHQTNVPFGRAGSIGNPVQGLQGLGACPGPRRGSHGQTRPMPIAWDLKVTSGQRILRNAVVIGASQPVSWALTLLFTIVVPRNVGPGEWGEWGIAWAVALVTRSGLDFGLNTLLLKEVPRRPGDAAKWIGAVLAVRLALAPVLVVSVFGFGILAHYPRHTWVVLAIVAISVAVSYVETPLTFGLQATQRMPASTVAGLTANLILSLGAVLLVKVVGAGVIAIASLAVFSNVVAGVMQWRALARDIPLRPNLDLNLIPRLIRQALPYWGSYIFFTVYVWIDGIMLSLMTPTREVGWYSVGVQVISSLGFLPYAVTTAVFPVLSASYHADRDGNFHLSARSFRILVSLSLPMVAGLILISGRLIPTLYGEWFAPASLNVAILALTLPPVFIATLLNAFVIAADRQAQWTWLMASVCVINPLLNLITIPYFHHAIGNGAAGAAVAVLLTDVITAVAAIALLPSTLRVALRSTLPPLGRGLLATLIMAAAVWPARGLFPAIPILVGVAAFVAASIALRVFSRDELVAIAQLTRRALPPRKGFASQPVDVSNEAEGSAPFLNPATASTLVD